MLPAELAEGYRRAGYWRDETLIDRFDAMCAEHAARTALLDAEAQLRFEQVAECVERVAQWFTTMTDPGDIVAWQLPNWWEAVVVHHAAIARPGTQRSSKTVELPSANGVIAPYTSPAMWPRGAPPR